MEDDLGSGDVGTGSLDIADVEADDVVTGDVGLVDFPHSWKSMLHAAGRLG